MRVHTERGWVVLASDAIAKLRQQASEHQRSVIAATKSAEPKASKNRDKAIPEEY